MTSSTERGDASESGGPRRCESNACIVADAYYGHHLTDPVVRIRSTQTGTVMQATMSEWLEFVRQVKLGRWDVLPLADAELPAETPI